MSLGAAVLVIPAEGDPGGLLAEGPCYAWPPRVGLAHEWMPMTWDEQGAYDTEALPLWWDGALVPEGWDRAMRSFFPRSVAGRGLRAYSWFGGENLYQVLTFAGWLQERGLASRVIRLARVDGRLVEVGP